MKSADVALRQALQSSAWQQLERYLEWQRREERKEEHARIEHSAVVIANGDPECEAVIAALERGWTTGKGR